MYMEYFVMNHGSRIFEKKSHRRPLKFQTELTLRSSIISRARQSNAICRPIQNCVAYPMIPISLNTFTSTTGINTIVKLNFIDSFHHMKLCAQNCASSLKFCTHRICCAHTLQTIRRNIAVRSHFGNMTSK